MRTLRFISACLFALVLFATYDGAQAASAGAPGQGQAPAGQAQSNPFGAPAQQPVADQQPATSCGNQPLCIENDDLAAMVTSFRTSQQSVYKVIDVSLRFLNKTNEPLVLGYAVNSGTATDERGNRYIVWGQNGTRGIGLVAGNNFDARLTLRPGGFGDAQFELMWRPNGSEVIGSSFVLDITVDKIAVDRNLMTMGGEYPLHFQGLADGVGGAAPASAPATGQTGGGGGGGMSAAMAGCTPTSAPTSASGATTALSNLRSIFKRGNQTTAAQNVANGQSPCPAGSTPADASAGGTPGAAAPAANATPSAVPSMSATPGVSPAPAMRANTGAPATAAAPAKAASPNATPAPVMRANTVPGGRTPATGNPNQPMMQPGNATPQAGRAAFPAKGAMNQSPRGMAATPQPARGQVQQPQAAAANPQARGPANVPAGLRPQVLRAAPQPGRPATPPAPVAKPQAAANAKVPPKKPANATQQTK